jgi:hypothetical protein
MGIINRTKDTSEQKEAFNVEAVNVANSTDILVKVVERACTITDAKFSLLGISGSPVVLLKGLRFIAGTGGSSFLIGASMPITAFGTSGYISYSLPATGSSQLSLQKGDLLVVQTLGGTGAACTAVIGEIVVQNIQDIKTWY